LATTKAEYTSKHVENGFNFCERKIGHTTLDAICKEHEVGEVHFLKINVGGAECDVREGFSFTHVRPWIVVIKATAPMSNQDKSSDLEDLILRRQYDPVYFDGLNRYYVSYERKELAEHFLTPKLF
jgi:Methyltransferase FkbM domain